MNSLWNSIIKVGPLRIHLDFCGEEEDGRFLILSVVEKTNLIRIIDNKKIALEEDDKETTL